MDIIEDAQRIMRSYGDMPADEIIRAILKKEGFSMDEYTAEATAERMRANIQAIEQAKPTAQQVADGLATLAPVLEQVWQQTMNNDAIWQARIDGPIYRSTPLLGRFRWYRRFRVWQVRRELRKV